MPPSFWRNIFRPSPTLSNTGSTARDHLASERTFLAWTRTGLGFTALGIALERFSQLDPSLRYPSTNPAAAEITPAPAVHPNPTTPPVTLAQAKSPAEIEAERAKEHILVGALLSLGCGSIVYASARYFSNLRLLEQGLFKPAYWGASGLSVGVAGLAGGAYVSALRERLRVMERERERDRTEGQKRLDEARKWDRGHGRREREREKEKERDRSKSA